MTPMKKENKKSDNSNNSVDTSIVDSITPNHPDWTEYVLSLLTDDEKISGNPTTDGLRRVFETALNCMILSSCTSIVQCPDISNEKRATAVHELQFKLKDEQISIDDRNRCVSGAADVYWGNCDKIYRNHPVAVAETRAEGRALRRGLKLRKVVAAEEIAKEIEDDVDGNSVSKITNNQINFIDVIAKRIDVDVIKLIELLKLELKNNNVYGLSYDSAVAIITKLSDLQRDISSIDTSIKNYNSSWK